MELRAAYSSTSRACSSVTPGNQLTNSCTEASSSRFSNSAAMGTRVPRKSHAPLTVAGCCSAAEQEDQSIMPAMVHREATFGPALSPPCTPATVQRPTLWRPSFGGSLAVLGLAAWRRTRFVRCALVAQTTAPSQTTKRLLGNRWPQTLRSSAPQRVPLGRGGGAGLRRAQIPVAGLRT